MQNSDKGTLAEEKQVSLNPNSIVDETLNESENEVQGTMNTQQFGIEYNLVSTMDLGNEVVN